MLPRKFSRAHRTIPKRTCGVWASLCIFCSVDILRLSNRINENFSVKSGAHNSSSTMSTGARSQPKPKIWFPLFWLCHRLQGKQRHRYLKKTNGWTQEPRNWRVSIWHRIWRNWKSLMQSASSRRRYKRLWLRTKSIPLVWTFNRIWQRSSRMELPPLGDFAMFSCLLTVPWFLMWAPMSRITYFSWNITTSDKICSGFVIENIVTDVHRHKQFLVVVLVPNANEAIGNTQLVTFHLSLIRTLALYRCRQRVRCRVSSVYIYASTVYLHRSRVSTWQEKWVSGSSNAIPVRYTVTFSLSVRRHQIVKSTPQYLKPPTIITFPTVQSLVKTSSSSVISLISALLSKICHTLDTPIIIHRVEV